MIPSITYSALLRELEERFPFIGADRPETMGDAIRGIVELHAECAKRMREPMAIEDIVTQQGAKPWDPDASRGELSDTEVDELLEAIHSGDGRSHIDALQIIASLGGNLPDERLTNRTGANDAAHRGLLYCEARRLARAALASKPLYETTDAEINAAARTMADNHRVRVALGVDEEDKGVQ